MITIDSIDDERPEEQARPFAAWLVGRWRGEDRDIIDLAAYRARKEQERAAREARPDGVA